MELRNEALNASPVARPARHRWLDKGRTEHRRSGGTLHRSICALCRLWRFTKVGPGKARVRWYFMPAAKTNWPTAPPCPPPRGERRTEPGWIGDPDGYTDDWGLR